MYYGKEENKNYVRRRNNLVAYKPHKRKHSNKKNNNYIKMSGCVYHSLTELTSIRTCLGVTSDVEGPHDRLSQATLNYT